MNTWYSRERRETDRGHDSYTISPYDFADTYLPQYRLGMANNISNASGVMCSYNAINGVPSCANTWLLQTTAREAWGFDGYITSDSGAVEDIYEKHKYSADGPSGVAVPARERTCILASQRAARARGQAGLRLGQRAELARPEGHLRCAARRAAENLPLSASSPRGRTL